MSESVLLRGVTRRTFLKATAATAAVATVGDKLFGGPVSTLVGSAEAAKLAVTEDVWIPTACWHCSSGCPQLAHRVNGVVIKIEGNPDSSHSRGRACAKGHASIMRLYNPYQVRAPLKRTNPERARKNPDTGEWEIVDPGWVEISWEEALDTVAQKLKSIHADNPAKFVQMDGWNIKENIAVTRFPRAFGTPNRITGYGGLQCGAAMHFAAYLNTRVSTYSGDSEYCKWSVGTGGLNKGDVQNAQRLAEKKGDKSIVVDPRYSISAMKADEWIPIRPGTGASMACSLAMINTIVNEMGTYDVEFLKKRSNAPYLIGPDGFYVRASEPLVEDPARNNIEVGPPLIWDPVDEMAKPWNDETIQDFALEGEYEVDGVEAKPAFQLLKEHVKQYTPEWAAEISDVPAETIRRLAKEFVEAAQIGSTIVIDGQELPYRPANIGTFSSRNRHHGTWVHHARCILNQLVGNWGVPGGFKVGSSVVPNPADGVVEPGGHTAYRFKWPPDAYQQDTFYPMAYKAWQFFWFQLLDREKYGTPYEVEALAVMGANPIMDGGSPDIGIEAFTKLPFVWALAYHLDEPCEMADIVMPEPGWTGRYSEKNGLRQPLLEQPLYDQRSPEDILTELAVRVGFLEDWNKQLNRRMGLKEENELDPETRYSWEEIMERYLKRRYGAEYGLEWFKKNGVKERPQPAYENYGYYHSPETRYPLYWEYVKWRGEQLKRDLDAVGVEHPHPEAYEEYQALPPWAESAIDDVAPEYDLFAINWKGNLMAMGMTADNPWLYEVMERFDPYVMNVMINTETAAARGIKDGDLVVVESGNTGLQVEGEARVTECIHPEAVGIGGQYGRYSPHMNPFTREGPHYNRLPSIEAKYTDPLACGFDIGSKVKVYKA